MAHPATRFGRGRRTLLVFVVAFPALIVVLNLLEGVSVLNRIPGFDGIRTALGMTILVGLAVALLQREGVSLPELGFQTRLAVPALLGVAALWTVLNLAALAAAAGTGTTNAVGFLYDRPLPAIAGTVLVQYGFVAVGEELALRGFLQNKLVALFGGPERRRNRALGIVLMGLTFGLMHVPDRIVSDGLDAGALVGSVLVVALSGIAFGVIYDLTRNLYLVVFLHGTGNFYPLFVDVRALPDDLQVAFNAVRILAYVGLVLAYRAWGPTSGESHRGSESDAAAGTD
jgi:membrane protease YdiL (CAAX protease family)